jgi:PAS domain S-box-containing protein
MQKFILMLIFMTLSFNTLAKNNTLIINKSGNKSATPFLFWFNDSTREMQLQQIINLPEGKTFQPVNGRLFNHQAGNNVFWFKFDVINQSASPVWFLDISYAPFDRVTIYLQNNKGQIDSLMQDGLLVPGSTFLQDRSAVVCDLHLNYNETYSVFIKVESTAYILLPVFIRSTEEMINRSVTKNRFLFSLLAFILFSGFLNLFFYLKTYDRTYLLLFLVFILIVITAAYQYGIDITPSLPHTLKTKARVFGLWMTMLVFNLFAIRYLEVNHNKSLLRLFNAISACCLVMIASTLMPFIPQTSVNLITPYANFFIIIAYIIIGIYCTLKKNKHAYYFLLYNLVFVISSLIWLLLINNRLPYSITMHYISLITISFSGLMLSYGASEKISEVETEKKKKLQVELKKLNTAIEKSANSILITDANGTIEYVNEYYTELTGFPADEVIGKKPSITKSGYHSPEFYKELWDTIKSGRIWKGEFQNCKKNGESYWESSTITPITDDSGAISHFIAIKQNITDNKKQLEVLQQSEKKLRELNATKDKFFSIIGHDLMDPFNALTGFTNMLIESLKNKDYRDSLEYAGVIQQSSQRILNLLQNLLIWSRSQRGKIELKPELTDLSSIISDALSILAHNAKNKNIDVKTEFTGQLKAAVDYNMINTVIRNLFLNAVKFTPSGGSILIRTEKSDNHLIFSISDTGCGINKEKLENLFQLESTLSSRGYSEERGTGLGLIICKEFIDIHKGKIWAESTQGKGSTFYFSIPDGLSQLPINSLH